MIENADLVLERHPGGFEAGNCGNDMARSHITRGIAVKTNDQYTGVRAVTCPYNLVQVQEIVMISRQQKQ